LKKSVLIASALALLGALLLALCFSDNAASLLCFIALVPMLIVVKKSSFLHSAIFTLINSALVVLIIRITSVEMSIEASIGQFLILALPWIFYQHIRINHNEKLGYLALVSGWIFLEWVAAQYFGSWTGLQLGHSLTGVPFLVKWYGFLGVSAGSVWILAINIQLSRVILPAQSFTRKKAIINGLLVVILPVLVSVFWLDSEKKDILSVKLKEENGKTLLQSENDKSLSANELIINQHLYNIAFDTVKNALIRDKEGNESAVVTKKLRVGSIEGVKYQHLTISDFDKNRIGLINGSSILRADLLRLYALEKCGMIICYADKSTISPQIVRSRALENNIDILLLKKDQATLFLKTGEEKEAMKEIRLETKKTGFFSHYGDLIGRLSIFVSIWMLLGSIVKPFRKK
jgi:hypothetical protein